MEFAKLADGNQLPMLGLGVWQVPDGKTCENAVRWALELGYRHIDTAQAYGNEASVGKALQDSGVPRDEVFITTKFYPGRKDPVAEAEKSLKRLRIDQVDLYLVHWPQRGPTWAWPGMERARERGLTRSIGVSNFSAADLDQVIAAGATSHRASPSRLAGASEGNPGRNAGTPGSTFSPTWRNSPRLWMLVVRASERGRSSITSDVGECGIDWRRSAICLL